MKNGSFILIERKKEKKEEEKNATLRGGDVLAEGRERIAMKVQAYIENLKAAS